MSKNIITNNIILNTHPHYRTYRYAQWTGFGICNRVRVPFKSIQINIIQIYRKGEDARKKLERKQKKKLKEKQKKKSKD